MDLLYEKQSHNFMLRPNIRQKSGRLSRFQEAEREKAEVTNATKSWVRFKTSLEPWTTELKQGLIRTCPQGSLMV